MFPYCGVAYDNAHTHFISVFEVHSRLRMRDCLIQVANSRFSHDVTAAMLEPLNKETAAMLSPDQILREFNSIIMQMLSFVFVAFDHVSENKRKLMHIFVSYAIQTTKKSYYNR